MIHVWRMRRTLLALQRGELSAAARRRVESHLAHCAACRDTLRAWEEADRLLQAARPEPVALSSDAVQSIFVRALAEAGVQADGRPKSGRRHSPVWSLGLTGLAALALLAVRPHFAVRGKDVRAAIVRTPFDPSPNRPTWSGAGAVPQSTSSPVEDWPALANAPTGLHPLTPGPSATRPRRRRWGTLLLAAAHHRRRHHYLRHRRLTLPEPETMVAQAMPEPEEPHGHLTVMVTHEPGLRVEVTHSADDAPGYAQATCFRRDTYGMGIWQRCMIRKDETGADTVQTQVAVAVPQPERALLIVQAATGAVDNKEQSK